MTNPTMSAEERHGWDNLIAKAQHQKALGSSLYETRHLWQAPDEIRGLTFDVIVAWAQQEIHQAEQAAHQQGKEEGRKETLEEAAQEIKWLRDDEELAAAIRALAEKETV